MRRFYSSREETHIKNVWGGRGSFFILLLPPLISGGKEDVLYKPTFSSPH